MPHIGQRAYKLMFIFIPGGRGEDSSVIITLPECSAFSDIPEESLTKVLSYLTLIPRSVFILYNHVHLTAMQYSCSPLCIQFTCNQHIPKLSFPKKCIAVYNAVQLVCCKHKHFGKVSRGHNVTQWSYLRFSRSNCTLLPVQVYMFVRKHVVNYG